MAFPETFDPTTPADTDNPSQGAAKIRALTLGITDVFGVPVSPSTVAAAAGLIETTGAGYVVARLTNQTGVSLVKGDVAAVSTANDKAVVLDDTAASANTFVVALEAISNTVEGRFAIHGRIDTVNSTGTIARGQYVRKSATTKVVEDAGTAIGATSPPPAGAIGVALNAAAAGVVSVFLFGAPTSSGGGSPVLPLTNKTGVSLVVGDVVALDTANAKAVALGDVQSDVRPYVVSLGSVGNNGVGLFATAGIVVVNTTGTIALGQYVRKSTTTKVVEDAGVTVASNQAPPVGALGIALTTAAVGQATISFFERPNLGNALSLTNKTGGANAVGDVVALDTANNTAVALDDTQSSFRPYVVALQPTGSNALGLYAGTGVVTVNTIGTINRGEYIRKSATAKVAETTGVSAVASLSHPVGAIGLALTAAVGNQCTALLFNHSVTNANLRSYLAGLGMANNGTNPTTQVDIAAGTAMGSTNAVLMALSATLTKDLTVAWAVGSGNGGLDTGVVGNNTYHVWLIQRSDTGVVDALFSLSVSAPTMPANYDTKRRIGSVIRSGGSILAFTQDGDYFRLSASIRDINANNPGTAAVTRTLTVPTGVNVHAFMNVVINGTAENTAVYLSDLAANDEACSGTAAPGISVGMLSGVSTSIGGSALIRTNTSAQIRSRLQFSDANVTLIIVTLGWWDSRGRNA